MPYQEGERQERTPYLENYIRAEGSIRKCSVQTELGMGNGRFRVLGLRASGSRGQGFKVLRMSKV